MRIEFQYTVDDLQEGNATDTAARAAFSGSASRSRKAKNLLLFILLLAAGICIVVWAAIRVDMMSASLPGASYLFAAVPWIVIGGIVFFVVFYQQRKKPVKPWERQRKVIQPPAKPRRAKPAIWGWIAFIGLAVVGFLMLRKSGSHDPTTSSDTASSGLLSLVWPLALFVGVLFVTRWATRGNLRRQWNNHSAWHRPYTVEADEESFRLAEPYSRTTMDWEGFEGWIESANLFLLYHSPMLYRMVPKRAFATEAETNEFRDLITRKIGERPHAFPVLPAQPPSPAPRPVEPLEQREHF